MGAGDVAAEPTLRTSDSSIRLLMYPPGTPRPFLAAACLAAFALWASAGQPAELSQAVATRLPAFRDVARSVGLDFVHVNGASEQRFFPEIVGSGGLFFDFDNDGWLDVFLVDGGSLADAAVASRARHRLYRNRGPSALREPQGGPEQGRGTSGSGQ